MSERIEIGYIHGAHGVKGELTLRCYGEVELGEGQELFFKDKSGAKTLTVRSTRPHKGDFLVFFKEVIGRDEALLLKGTPLFMDKDELPELEEDEYYHFDIVGMDVVTDTGVALGAITEIIETGAANVYQVEGDLGETLLPAIPDVVLDIDINARRMTVHLLEGLVPEKKPDK